MFMHLFSGKRTHAKGSPGFIPTIFPWSKKETSRSSRTSGAAGSVTPLPFCEDSWSPREVRETLSTKKQIDAAAKKAEAIQKKAADNTKRVWRETGHDYLQSAEASASVHDDELRFLSKKVAELTAENKALKEKIFSLASIKEKDEDFQRYTNLPNYGVFQVLANYLYAASNSGQLIIGEEVAQALPTRNST